VTFINFGARAHSGYDLLTNVYETPVGCNFNFHDPKPTDNISDHYTGLKVRGLSPPALSSEGSGVVD